jgi:hypothetical protein
LWGAGPPLFARGSWPVLSTARHAGGYRIRRADVSNTGVGVTERLRDKMLGDSKLRGVSDNTRETYLRLRERVRAAPRDVTCGTGASVASDAEAPLHPAPSSLIR